MMNNMWFRGSFRILLRRFILRSASKGFVMINFLIYQAQHDVSYYRNYYSGDIFILILFMFLCNADIYERQ